MNKFNKVGIIGAMEVEVETLKKDMEVERTVSYAHMDFFEGMLCGMKTVVVRSGIGKVNAAVCTQILVDLFEVDAVINTGIAGSLNAALDIGDIVISNNVVHHDVDVAIFGCEPGEIPQLGAKSFDADADLIEVAQKVCAEVNPDINTKVGRVASGDQFISSKEQKARIISTFGALCAEMEGASIGHTAWLNDKPFVILRAISDKADESATEDYPSFEKKAAEHCVKLSEGILKELAG